MSGAALHLVIMKIQNPTVFTLKLYNAITGEVRQRRLSAYR